MCWIVTEVCISYHRFYIIDGSEASGSHAFEKSSYPVASCTHASEGFDETGYCYGADGAQATHGSQQVQTFYQSHISHSPQKAGKAFQGILLWRWSYIAVHD